MKVAIENSTNQSAEFDAVRALIDAAKLATEKGERNARDLWRIAAQQSKSLLGIVQTSIFAYAEYAYHLILAGEYVQAQSILQEYLKHSIAQNGNPDSLTICILQRLGALMRKLGRDQASANYYIQGAEVAEAIYGSIDRTAQFCHSMAGRALIGARKFKDALTHLTRAKEISSHLDGCNVKVAYACRDLIACHMRMRNWTDAYYLAVEARNLINDSGVACHQHQNLRHALSKYLRRSSMQMAALIKKSAS